ncbi:NADH dehydrogenase [ubiquinone] 1 alpha subcomplex subunit 12 [Rhynchospora pubera]|uniref:NADH dehydrogenase [ubiquinone] 1 alpha subcomplex subunit 12 n=1 Tax=Rhynchospora pubera TaxID=906938 RepID=A0AAV8H370_9POAL|nr:NADH dehydrogenase [ubiquinone] 1 alpha subcomplex subunit 12 [Rhynchospora pubera]
MSKPKLLSRILSLFSSRTQVGVDKAGNRYFTRTEEIDGAMKEKRWVVYKGQEQDPTTIPVEWICWLNGQRKKAPTPEELIELEARRERVKQNIELLKKKEEEEIKSGIGQSKAIKKSDTPDLKSFMKQFPELSIDQNRDKEKAARPSVNKTRERSSEPTGSGASYQPGTWQPPS